MKNYHLLLETYSLTTYFRHLLKMDHSEETINFLLNNSELKEIELEQRWDSFNKIFGNEYGNKISALSFATIIKARGKLLNELIEKQNSKNITIELASGFTPRGLNLVLIGEKQII